MPYNNTAMQPKPWYQHAFMLAGMFTGGILAVGALLNAFVNAIQAVSFKFTVIGTIVIAASVFTAHLVIRWRPLRWRVFPNSSLRFIGLRSGIFAFAGGAVAVLWAPVLAHRVFAPVPQHAPQPAVSLPRHTTIATTQTTTGTEQVVAHYELPSQLVSAAHLPPNTSRNPGVGPFPDNNIVD